MAIIVDKEKCTLCGACASVCPAGAITVTSEIEIDRDTCLECGLCINECPVQALSSGEAGETNTPQPPGTSTNREQPAASEATGRRMRPAEGRSSGRRGGGRGQGLGSDSTCFCISCNKSFPHQRGLPCSEMKCPQCGKRLVRGSR